MRISLQCVPLECFSYPTIFMYFFKLNFLVWGSTKNAKLGDGVKT